jgi:hypothetical protein
MNSLFSMPGVNMAGVLAAAIVGMVIGALWYSPVLFAKRWMSLIRFSEQDLAKAKEGGMGTSYALAFLGKFVMSYVLANMLVLTGAVTLADGALIGFWAWLGFIATTTMDVVLWERKPWGLYVLNNAHSLVVILVIASMLTWWPW